MGNQVILKKSSVTSRVPTTGDLEYGELALNYTDGKLYFKTSTNTIDFFQSGSSSNLINSQFDTFIYTATASQTTFTGADDNSETLSYESEYITVFLNGVKLAPSDYTATNGTSIVLGSGAAVNDILEIVSYKTVNISNGDYVATITGTTNQVTVTGSGSAAAAVTLSLPQNIHTSATPTFAGVTANTHTFTHGVTRSLTLTTSTTTADQVLDSISASTYRSVKYQIQVTSSTSYHATEVTVVHDGTDTFITEYGTIITGSSLATFTADVSGGNLRLLTTPTNAVTTYKVIATAINA